MSKHHSHLNTARNIVSNYDARVPFAQVLKDFFKGQKKFGSQDRRQIGQLCFSYFRTAKILPHNIPLEEKILMGFLICSPTKPQALIAALKPEWLPLEALSKPEKLAHFGLNITSLFPEIEKINPEINPSEFALAHLEQAHVFLRLRPQQQKTVLQKLQNDCTDLQEISPNCFAFPSNIKIEDYLQINKQAVVQDYASQQVGNMLLLLKQLLPPNTNKPKVWDCCAASGGKSILAVDILQKLDLTVSDVRSSILQNLKTRFEQAQITQYKHLLLDLTNKEALKNVENFDVIIADVPCSGSGTWTRTPERLLYFSPNEAQKYTQLQTQIVGNIVTKLNKNGFLLYITCSVYQKENNEVVQYLVQKQGLKLIHSESYLGYNLGADTMFAALLQKLA